MSVGGDIQPIERYLFLLLFASDSSRKFSQPVRGNTWLQKEMFVLSKLNPQLADDAEFDAYAMGAYSDTVAEIQDEFYISGFAERNPEGIRLTLEGRKEAEKVWTHATDTERKTVSMVKTWLNDLTFNEMLAIVYAEYPESASKSQVLKQVDARLPDLAISLLKKGKVTPELARRITGLTSAQFEELLATRGVSKSSLETTQVLLDQGLMEDIDKSREDSRNRRLVPWERMNRKP
jgi:predicted HTH domain antitoxin